jgi:hypothetical protein|tara:strand:+ start:3802 stop:3984 length:183 start_codon:yes stop_codon:yes gene_type:complete
MRWPEEQIEPTLELLEIHSFYIPTGQILYVGDQSIGVLPGVGWEACNELLEISIAPRVPC